MARTTHDRILDHRGTDLDTNVLLNGAISSPGTTSSGSTVHQALVNINAAISGGGTITTKDEGSTLSTTVTTLDFVGSGVTASGAGATTTVTIAGGGSGGGITDYITGDDSFFTSTTGSWANSGGTLSRDTTSTYKFSSGYSASLKFVTTASGQYVELALAGTFTSGVEYQAYVALLQEETTASKTLYADVTLGLIGTDAATLTRLYRQGYPGHYAIQAIRWTPTADRTGVKLRVNRNASSTSGTITLHIGLARAINASNHGYSGAFMGLPPQNSTAAIATQTDVNGLGLMVHPGPQSTTLGVGGGVSGTTTGIQFNDNGSVYMSNPNAASIGVGALDDLVYIHGGSGTPATLNGSGIDLTVGDDYIDMIIGEKNSTTIQMYPGSSSGYDIEIVDRNATKVWKSVSSTGVVKNLKTMENRVNSGTATITSGNTAITVTHGAGYTPTAQDLVITPTNNPTNAPGNFWVDTIGGTTFAINVRSDPGASGAIFAWRVDR